ncbi:DISARM system phospholipase D-like protein DrmC [Yinghuangia sp. ASG 101]|uniref:DISARM system phospholipase D-like protein DrmC n=1 Tax=Yinghuangia sp. ASG 101 TaxID=2896848 RepID=UPI001E44A041|nr:DISARM system phospholipase D-like protein DrmC [Yinghuangia sp. ASG 101]UGQ11290.1 DISARM system phospholipase D-like protein DrmC [Yinghuangia sp. ASG 101]
MSARAFESAAGRVAAALGASRIRTLAGHLTRGRDGDYILDTLHAPEAVDPVRELLEAAGRAGMDGRETAAYLRGFVAGWTSGRGEVDVRTVWSGPSTNAAPTRSTAQVLVEVVNAATAELIIMSYSARAYRPLTEALRAAHARGVRVDAVLETKVGSGGLLSGPEPARAFESAPGVRLWHWPGEERPSPGARQHAKIAVADGRLLFLGSANLTESGARRNIEAGLLVRGGAAPQRVADHVHELQRRGVLRRFTVADLA